MATVSRQSAFWAVVALGLNTFTQDGGKVLGFPAEYSRALRLSPIVCIVDTLGVLFSLTFFCVKTRSFKDGLKLAARYRCFVEDDPAEPKLERTWWFRFSVFALGALPQAMKILGMGGIPLTKTWGMAYLVSFLVLEGLDLLQPRQHRDYHAVEMDVEEVLDGYLRLPGFLAVFTQHLCFLLQLYLSTSKLDLTCYMERGSNPPEFGRAKNALFIVGLMACYALVMSTIYVAGYLVIKKFAIRTPFLGALMEGTQIILWIVACAIPLSHFAVSYQRVPRCAFSPGLVLILTMSLLLTSIMLPFLLNDMANEDRWFRQTPFVIRRFRELFGLKRWERGNGKFFLLFALLSIESIMCYYSSVYNPSKTYKPPWTEYLG